MHSHAAERMISWYGSHNTHNRIASKDRHQVASWNTVVYALSYGQLCMLAMKMQRLIYLPPGCAGVLTQSSGSAYFMNFMTLKSASCMTMKLC